MAKLSSRRTTPRKSNQDPMVIKVEAIKADQSKTGLLQRACNFDFTALRDGRAASGRGAAFTGRPKLALQVGRAIQDLVAENSLAKGTLEVWRAACTHLWLSLDRYEKSHPEAGRIDSVEQLPGEFWTTFCFDLARGSRNVAHDSYSYLTKLLRRAKPGIHLGAQPFSKDPTPQRRRTTDPYSIETLAEMKTAFRKEREALVRRFEEANALADQGEPPATTLELYRRKVLPFDEIWTPANTLRFVRELLLPTLPNTQQILDRHGVWTVQIGIAPDAPAPVAVEGAPVPAHRFADGSGLVGLYRHFAPSYRDLVALAAEAELEGHNPQCILDYDRERCIRDSIDTDFAVLASRKSRSKGKLVEPVSPRSPGSLHDIISTAITITEPLCKAVDTELEGLRAMGGRADADRIEHLEFLRKRVWLTLKARDVGVGWLRQDVDFRRAANEILVRHGVKEHGVQVRWDSRRCRDRKASKLFDMEKSLEQARIEMHHQSKNTTFGYMITPERTRSENDVLRERFEELASFRNWPKIPTAFTPAIAGSLEMIVTAQGREWLAQHRPLVSKETLQ